MSSTSVYGAGEGGEVFFVDEPVRSGKKAEPRMLTLKQINVQNRSTQVIDEKAILENNMFSNVAFVNQMSPDQRRSTLQ
ncbi:hypothetical protein PO909_007900 [Leuciscus waleckii]